MPDGTLIVIDYKATSKETKIETLSDSSWEESYKRQMGVYQWLLRKKGFVVSDTGYFVYANAIVGDKREFSDTLSFETTLVPCTGKTDWIDQALIEIKNVFKVRNSRKVVLIVNIVPIENIRERSYKQFIMPTKS